MNKGIGVECCFIERAFVCGYHFCTMSCLPSRVDDIGKVVVLFGACSDGVPVWGATIECIDIQGMVEEIPKS